MFKLIGKGINRILGAQTILIWTYEIENCNFSKCTENHLAHQNGVSTDFTQMRKFYLTYPVPIEQLYVSQQVTSFIRSQCIQELLEAFFKYKNAVFYGEQEKETLFG